MPTLEAWTVNNLSLQLGIDRRELDRLIAEVGLKPVNPDQRMKKYILKDIFNAAKYGSRKLDLTQIKAESHLEDVRRKKRENDMEESLVAPVEVIEETIGKVAVEVASMLDTILPGMRHAVPTLTDRDLMMIDKELAKCRNAIAEIRYTPNESEI